MPWFTSSFLLQLQLQQWLLWPSLWSNYAVLPPGWSRHEWLFSLKCEAARWRGPRPSFRLLLRFHKCGRSRFAEVAASFGRIKRTFRKQVGEFVSVKRSKISIRGMSILFIVLAVLTPVAYWLSVRVTKDGGRPVLVHLGLLGLIAPIPYALHSCPELYRNSCAGNAAWVMLASLGVLFAGFVMARPSSKASQPPR